MSTRQLALRRDSTAMLKTPSRRDSRDFKVEGAVRIKVLSLGSAGVGKSCIIKRYCEGRFVAKYISTVGVDYGVKPIRVNFWDLSGRQEFLEIRNEFYKDTQGAMCGWLIVAVLSDPCNRLVFDVTDRDTFVTLDGWLSEAWSFGMAKDLPVVVCANKIDKPRKVSEDEARAWAAKRGYEYFETSANSGASIEDLFTTLFKLAFRRANRTV